MLFIRESEDGGKGYAWSNRETRLDLTLGPDWRPATRREAIRYYWTSPRFSWIEFMALVFVAAIIKAALESWLS